MAITLNSVVCPGCAKQLDVDNKGCPHCGYEDNVRGRILPIGELIQLPSPEIGRANRFNDVCPAFLASIVSATRAGNASAQAESVETGPTAGEQVTILANAIGEFLAQIGMVNESAPMSGPQLIQFLGEAAVHHSQIAARLQGMKGLQVFANSMVNIAFEGGDASGADIQEQAVENGLLEAHSKLQACSDTCACAEFGFPTVCNRKTSLLTED